MVQIQAIAAIAVGNACFLHSTVFPLLEEGSLAMAHMDPSDIIATPFPLYQLCKFVALSLVWNLFVAFMCRAMLKDEIQTDTDYGNQSGSFHIILMIGWMIGLSTISIHLIFILCGIHPTIFPLLTLVSAFYLAFNMLIPILLFMPRNCVSRQEYEYYFIEEVVFELKEVSNYIFGPPLTKEQTKKQQRQQQNQNRIQYIHQYTALGTIIGMAACAILRIFDHGMQIQRYPFPIIVGATWGSCGGILMGAFLQALGEVIESYN
mmetsp:Transcript_10462/g.23222  ORF Transcript_10462/g.23222 Transcript_10462/m.23222 type:complete len:263 (-) Transcript_10462:1155-1943(-)